jgi:hypothetical protein
MKHGKGVLKASLTRTRDLADVEDIREAEASRPEGGQVNPSSDPTKGGPGA